MHFQVTPAVKAPANIPSDVVINERMARRLCPEPPLRSEMKEGVAQWINCDIRSFDYSVLGQ